MKIRRAVKARGGVVGLDLSLTGSAACWAPPDWQGDIAELRVATFGYSLAKDASAAEHVDRYAAIAYGLVGFCKENPTDAVGCELVIDDRVRTEAVMNEVDYRGRRHAVTLAKLELGKALFRVVGLDLVHDAARDIAWWFGGHRAGREDFLNRPSASESVAEDAEVHAKVACPVGQRHSEAVHFIEYGAASVFRLLGRRSPAAVSGLIVTIVVDAIDRVTSWFWPYVCEKSFEGSLPTLTDADPTTTVVFEELVSRVVDALKHVSPGPVFGCMREANHRSFSFEAEGDTAAKHQRVVRDYEGVEFIVGPRGDRLTETADVTEDVLFDVLSRKALEHRLPRLARDDRVDGQRQLSKKHCFDDTAKFCEAVRRSRTQAESIGLDKHGGRTDVAAERRHAQRNADHSFDAVTRGCFDPERFTEHGGTHVRPVEVPIVRDRTRGRGAEGQVEPYDDAGLTSHFHGANSSTKCNKRHAFGMGGAGAAKVRELHGAVKLAFRRELAIAVRPINISTGRKTLLQKCPQKGAKQFTEDNVRRLKGAALYWNADEVDSFVVCNHMVMLEGDTPLSFPGVALLEDRGGKASKRARGPR